MVEMALLAAMALGPWVTAAQDQPPTRLRHAHRLVILAEAGRETSVTVQAISASLGYPDPTSYELLSPDGKTIAHGSLAPGQSMEIKWTPKQTGVCVLTGDPARNAFAVEVRSPLWAVELKRGAPLQVISQARRLFFHVPEGLDRFGLSLNGEAATVTVLRPDGATANTITVPQYQTVTTSIDVPREARGKPWALDLKLAEDLSITLDAAIPGYVSEVPLTTDNLAKLRNSPRVLDFDLRPTPLSQLTSPRREGESIRLSTQDGLSLTWSRTGGDVRQVAVGEKAAPQSPLGVQPLSGFFARDMAKGSGLVPVTGRLTDANGALRLQGSLPGLDLDLDAAIAAKPDHFRVSGSLRDKTGQDRAITLYFALPIAVEHARWWDDIDTLVVPAEHGECGNWNSSGAGANGKYSAYPFGCVGREAAGVALGIPLTRPVHARIGYNPDGQQLYLAYDFGLTNDTVKFPSRADFEFVIYACDGDWGFRSAAEKYYAIFPESFEKRMAKDGSWACWGNVADCPRPDLYAFLYHWGPAGDPAVKWDDEHGVYSFLYNDSVRFFADLGAFDHRPTTQEANAVFRELLLGPDPRAFILSRPESATGRQRFVGLERSLGDEASAYCARCWEAVGRSAADDAQGQWIPGYIINRKDWGPENWWTGRLFCNPDPDIEGGYGRFVIDDQLKRTFADSLKNGAEYDGVGLDNYFVNANTLDFRREHFAAVNFPLTFDLGNRRPCVVGDFALWEWVAELAAWLRPEGKFLIANTCGMPFPFAAHWLDINGFEWNVERSAVIGRTLAYHKPVVTLPVKDEHYTAEWIEPNHLRFGIFPGGYPSSSGFKEPNGDFARAYRPTVEAVRALSAAGWEPVTYARSSDPEVLVERFGQGHYFTVANRSEQEREATITVDCASLKLVEFGFRDLLTEEAIPHEKAGPARASFALRLKPGQVRVIETTS